VCLLTCQLYLTPSHPPRQNEHHDFPKISGFRLPEVRKIAPEFYDERWKSHDGNGLTIHNSWVKVIYNYIVDPSVGPFSRIKRHAKYAKAS
jgi:sphingolipid 4-desaturase/C4-monooxygenase